MRLGLVVGALSVGPAVAQDGSPMEQGFYVAPMVSYVIPDNERQLDDGLGGTLALGYRFSRSIAVEAAGLFSQLDRDVATGGSTDMAGFNVSLLGFLSESLPGLYAAFGAGHIDTEEQGLAGGSYDGVTFEAGLGYILPLRWGDYDFGLRTEARYRHNNGQHDNVNNEYDGSGLADVLVNAGLHLPFGKRAAPPPPKAAPVAVVAPLAICADGRDNDGDGKIDFPSDPGCTSADDDNETDAKACSNGADDDGDGYIDYPDDKGCESTSDDDETDPCKTPRPGERVNLKGCGTGDVIILRGVNFDFDRASLTANAQSILDNVAEELNAYPDIAVELSGHTDALGSDQYNQQLSDRRAASVKRYLVGKGVAATRMSTVGYGESHPVADNQTDNGRELNRRVELKVTAGVAGASGDLYGDEEPSLESRLEAELDAEEAGYPAADED